MPQDPSKTAPETTTLTPASEDAALRATEIGEDAMDAQDPSLKHETGAPWRNFYGRRNGKTIRPTQRQHLDQDLADLSPGDVDWDINPDRHPIDIATRFKNKPIWVEIGFGGGEHLVHQAKTYPGIEIIGCEPFINGVAMLLGKIRKAAVENVAVHPGDARDLFDVLPQGSVQKAFLLYPDPWPKQRHHRRRFVTQDHLVPLYNLLAPGAEFRVATDIVDYVRQTLKEVPKAGFTLKTNLETDLHTPWHDWISTRYEKKAIREGRPQHYLTFQKPL